MTRRKKTKPKIVKRMSHRPRIEGSIFTDIPWYEDPVFKIMSSEWFLALLSAMLVLGMYKATI